MLVPFDRLTRQQKILAVIVLIATPISLPLAATYAEVEWESADGEWFLTWEAIGTWKHEGAQEKFGLETPTAWWGKPLYHTIDYTSEILSQMGWDPHSISEQVSKVMIQRVFK